MCAWRGVSGGVRPACQACPDPRPHGQLLSRWHLAAAGGLQVLHNCLSGPMGLLAWEVADCVHLVGIVEGRAAVEALERQRLW